MPAKDYEVAAFYFPNYHADARNAGGGVACGLRVIWGGRWRGHRTAAHGHPDALDVAVRHFEGMAHHSRVNAREGRLEARGIFVRQKYRELPPAHVGHMVALADLSR